MPIDDKCPIACVCIKKLTGRTKPAVNSLGDAYNVIIPHNTSFFEQ